MGLTLRRLTWTLCAGLLAVLIGERVVHDTVALRVVFSIAGLAAVLATPIAAAALSSRSEGEERRTARLFLLLYAGVALGVAGLLVGTDDVMRWTGMAFDGTRSAGRFRRAVWSFSSIVLASCLIPTLAAQWALRTHGGADPSRRHDTRRVLETTWSALGVALAGCSLMLLGYVASARDLTLDVSYFRTATPGSATVEIVRSLEQPLRARLFFPDIDPVRDEVVGYFRALERATDNVVIERYDRFAEPRLAEEYDVTEDGTVILSTGDREDRLLFPTELDAARGRLRVMDGEAQRVLLRLTRERRTVYLTTGHGELNERDHEPASETLPGGIPRSARPPLQALRQLLELLNYQVRELGVLRGLGSAVPDDAAAVLILGPARPLLDEEVSALEAYLEGGGSLLIAMERDSEFRLGRLGTRLGVEFRADGLVDERRHLRRRGAVSDRRLLVTDRIVAHPSVRTAGRQGPGSGIVVDDAGHLVATDEVEGLHVRFTIESLPSTFADVNGNLRFDEGLEQRGGFSLAAAVEGTIGSPADTLRALVYADADLFSDAVLSSLALNLSLVADGVRWLGHEEAFSGEIVSEEDVPIVHTRSANVAWFYAIILGAPAAVLAAGLAVSFAARGRRRAEG